MPLVGQYDSGRPPLRFQVDDLVQAFAGQGEWINGTIIKLWDQDNPYRIELEDGTNVWGPEDTNNFVRDRTPLEPLRFNIGDKVLANALGGWKTGHIIMVWDHGNPYRIELEDGTNVWGPEDIDKFVLPWTKEIPPMPYPTLLEGGGVVKEDTIGGGGHGHSHGGVACDGDHSGDHGSSSDEKKEQQQKKSTKKKKKTSNKKKHGHGSQEEHGHSHGGVACDVNHGSGGSGGPDITVLD